MQPTPEPAKPPAEAESDAPESGVPESEEPKVSEIGGREGLDPTRYGDWEKNGRCIDF
jgi:hypothetical protein